jgi:hypothetical protein
MDEASRNVTTFFRILNNHRDELAKLCTDAYALGSLSARVFMNVSGVPYIVHKEGQTHTYHQGVIMGVAVFSVNKEVTEYCIDLLWNESIWSIEASIMQDAEYGQEELWSCEKLATTLPEVNTALQQAIYELREQLYVRLQENTGTNEGQ